MTDLTDKVVLITGASKGIGAAIARHFAAEGAKVVLFARSQQPLNALAAELGENTLAVAGDVATYADVEAAVKAAVDTFGSLDVLVNNAGVIEPALIGDSDPDVWDSMVDVNFKGVYHGLRAAIPQMLTQGGGTIINISSGAATYVLEGWSNYCATKAGVLSLTGAAALEYGDKGILVVGLSPGTVATDMQAHIRSSGINRVSQLDWSAHIPPEWAAKAAAFLCGEGGAAFAGTDLSLKNNEGRALVGLPLIDA